MMVYVFMYFCVVAQYTSNKYLSGRHGIYAHFLQNHELHRN